jgi:hypothetical protein
LGLLGAWCGLGLSQGGQCGPPAVNSTPDTEAGGEGGGGRGGRKPHETDAAGGWWDLQLQPRGYSAPCFSTAAAHGIFPPAHCGTIRTSDQQQDSNSAPRLSLNRRVTFQWARSKTGGISAPLFQVRPRGVLHKFLIITTPVVSALKNITPRVF